MSPKAYETGSQLQAPEAEATIYSNVELAIEHCTRTLDQLNTLFAILVEEAPKPEPREAKVSLTGPLKLKGQTRALASLASELSDRVYDIARVVGHE